MREVWISTGLAAEGANHFVDITEMFEKPQKVAALRGAREPDRLS